MKAFETMPGSVASDQWASSVRPKVVWRPSERTSAALFGDMDQKGSAIGRPSAVSTLERDEEEEDE